jgi:hypothetical protein
MRHTALIIIILLIAASGCSQKPVSRPQLAAAAVKPVHVDITRQKQREWQWAAACKAKHISNWNTDIWLSTDPNHRCCDIYRDGIVNFKDLSFFLQKYR